MNKQESLMIKGVAILLMVFLHLFKINYADLYCSLFNIGGTPLPAFIARMANPVPFFLILSGYGLYASYQVGGGKNNWKRVLNIYIHLWLIYLIFVPLGSQIKPEMYPGSMLTFVENATSWRCSYIGEQWFLFPYLLLMLCSKWIFKVFDKIKPVWLLLLVCVIGTGTTGILKVFGEDRLASIGMLFYNVFLALNMLLSFTFGMLAKRCMWVEGVREMIDRTNNYVPLSGLWLLIIISVFRCFIPNHFVQPYFAIVFVLLFSTIPLAYWLKHVLMYLGKHSMNVWLIHTWICYRLFQTQIYSLKWPILIYVTLLILSLAISHIIEWLYIPIKKITKI